MRYVNICPVEVEVWLWDARDWSAAHADDYSQRKGEINYFLTGEGRPGNSLCTSPKNCQLT